MRQNERRQTHSGTGLWFAIILILIIAVGSGCGARPRGGPADQMPATPEPGKGTPQQEEKLSDAGAYGVAVDRKIVRNADVSIDVADLNDAVHQMELHAERMGGYLQDSSTGSGREDKQVARLTLRLPSARFTEALQFVESLGKTTSRRVFVEDVTEQYTDLESRVTNLLEQQKRLREILRQATKVEDILQIERELERVRMECDSLSGRLRLLKSRVEMSTISATLRETSLAGDRVSGKPLESVWSRGVTAFVENTNFLVDLGADIIVLLMGAFPTLVLLAATGAVALVVRNRLIGRGKPPRAS